MLNVLPLAGSDDEQNVNLLSLFPQTPRDVISPQPSVTLPLRSFVPRMAR